MTTWRRHVMGPGFSASAPTADGSPSFTIKDATRYDLLRGSALGADFVERVPGSRLLEPLIDALDVLDAFGLEPLAEGFLALLGEDRYAVCPRGPAAEHAVELDAGLGSEVEIFSKFV